MPLHQEANAGIGISPHGAELLDKWTVGVQIPDTGTRAELLHRLSNADENGEQKEAFPEPIHGLWDLDVLASSTTESHIDEIPQWVHNLNQGEANRLLHTMDDLSKGRMQAAIQDRERVLDRFFSQTWYFAGNAAERRKVVEQIERQFSVAHTYVREWLKRHTYDDLPEIEGKYVKKPGALRMQEQKQIIKPNLRRIFDQHFRKYPLSPAERTFMDIGSWDGEIPDAMRSYFQNIVAIEPNEERFSQLSVRDSPTFHCINANLQQVMDAPELYSYRPDAIYMGHVHYFLRFDDQDFRSFDWAKQTLSEGGIAVVTLNDMVREFPSRTHLRNTMGVHESNPNPEDYRKYLEQKGIAVRVMRPTLRMKAQTTEGLQALRDVFKYSLPGETRHKHALIDRYLQQVQSSGGIFKHTLYVMVMYQDAQTARAQKTFLPEMGADIGDPRLGTTTSAPPVSQATRTQRLDITTLQPVVAQSLPPQRILELLELIPRETDFGTNGVRLSAILTQLQIPHSVYHDWQECETEIQTAADRGDTVYSPPRPVERKPRSVPSVVAPRYEGTPVPRTAPITEEPQLEEDTSPLIEAIVTATPPTPVLEKQTSIPTEHIAALGKDISALTGAMKALMLQRQRMLATLGMKVGPEPPALLGEAPVPPLPPASVERPVTEPVEKKISGLEPMQQEQRPTAKPINGTAPKLNGKPHGRPSMPEEDYQRWLEYKADPENVSLRNVLADRYLPLVKYQAERVHVSLPETVELGDIIANGVFGLLDAIDRYDLERGVKFETFCVPRIRGAMLDGLRADDWVPRLVRSQVRKIAAAREAFERKHERNPQPEELAAELGIDLSAFEKLMRDAHVVNIASLQSIVFKTDSNKTVGIEDLLVDTSVPSVTHDLEVEEGFSMLLTGLNSAERTLLTLYYQQNKTMKEIGVVLGLDETRISQLHSSLLKHLRYRCQMHFGKGDYLDSILRRFVPYDDREPVNGSANGHPASNGRL